MRKAIGLHFAMLLSIGHGGEAPVAGVIAAFPDDLWYKLKWKNSSDVARGKCSRRLRDSSGDRSWRSLQRSNVHYFSEVDERESLDYGMEELQKKDQNEMSMAFAEERPNLAWPSRVHQNLFKISHPLSIELARRGFAIDHATKFLQDRYQLNKSDVTFNIMQSSILAQDEFCDDTGVSSSCPAFQHYRSSNGICNNLKNPLWGSSFRPFRRIAPSDYGDGVMSLRLAKDGQPLPSARLVSSTVNNIRPNRESSLISVLHMTYGQFLDHDLTFTPLNKGQNGEAISCCPDAQGEAPNHHPECAAIDIPEDDPFYSKFEQTCMEFVRSAPAPRCKFGPREQINEKTAYIDGSQIYGIGELMDSLRKKEDGLLISQVTSDGEELLPANTDLSNECNKPNQAAINRFCFRAGDGRVNEQVLLVLFHTVWARHHNHLASRLKDVNPSWDDLKLYVEARRILGAQLQHVTYNEYLPPIFGDNVMEMFNLKPLLGKQRKIFHKPYVSAGISSEFSTAAFRFGHSQIAGHLEIVEDSGDISCAPTSTVFMNPFPVYIKGAIPQLTRGEVRQSAAGVDPFFTPQVSSKLFGGSSPFGLDLVALDLQRGRDHGIASYTTIRSICGYAPISGFDDLKEIMDEGVVENLKNIYSHVDDIDLFIGGLAEHAIPDGIVGPTFGCVLMDQFIRLKIGDRYWYETDDKDTRFSKTQVREIRQTTLAGIMCEAIPELKEIQERPMKLVSPENPIRPCSYFPQIDPNYWKE
ncbi:peroxidase-like [Penaeus japonicus]|uniref:peroxidase-like n=1 Tax=Penaeus japonicus TaxID=27405 RepID=UPI001C711019|nr:peroxidase-like [Penaeus japonicus]